MDNVLIINSEIGRIAAAKVVGLKNKVKASMCAVLKENWMTTDDSELFKASIGGALIDLENTEDGKTLLESVNALRKLTAFLKANEAGLDVKLPNVTIKILPLFQWWDEIKKKNT